CRAICGENCVWIVLRGRTLYSAAFPRRLFRDPRIHCCRWPIAGTWRMAVLPPAPQRTVALTTGLHQRDATDKCRDACSLHLRSWGSRRGRSVQLILGAGHQNRHVYRYPKVQNAQYLGLVSIVVRDYDEALAFYVGKLGFSLIED